MKIGRLQEMAFHVINPLSIVFAGPNGSGKSTLAEEMRARDRGFPSLYINAEQDHG